MTPPNSKRPAQRALSARRAGRLRAKVAEALQNERASGFAGQMPFSICESAASAATRPEVIAKDEAEPSQRRSYDES